MIALAQPDGPRRRKPASCRHKPASCHRKPAWHKRLLAMLPTVRRNARIAFRGLDADSRDDAVAEVIANVTVAFARLVALGKTHLAFPTVLAHFGISQFRDGRRVGNRFRISEVLSRHAQRRKRFFVERLDHLDQDTGEWCEAVVEDPRTPVPEQVAFRIDFPQWLAGLTRRNRKIAEALSVGNTTSEVAKRFEISPGRVSQLRNEFYRSWREFHHDAPSVN